MSSRGTKDLDRKSTRLNSSHVEISYAVFCLKKKTDARRVGSEHHDAGLHVQRLQRLEDADDEGPTSEVQECLGPTHSLRGPGSQHHPGETHAMTLSRVAPRRQTPKLAAHGRTTHSPVGRSD